MGRKYGQENTLEDDGYLIIFSLRFLLICHLIISLICSLQVVGAVLEKEPHHQEMMNAMMIPVTDLRVMTVRKTTMVTEKKKKDNDDGDDNKSSEGKNDKTDSR